MMGAKAEIKNFQENPKLHNGLHQYKKDTDDFKKCIDRFRHSFSLSFPNRLGMSKSTACQSALITLAIRCDCLVN
jgi:hypothetical protein